MKYSGFKQEHHVGNSHVYQMDCMDFLKQTPDKFYNLAICDPPYGINASEMTMGKGKNKGYFKGKKWDNETPDSKYFRELSRVSINQIIWGGNYFDLPLTGGWIFWDKMRGKEVSFADGELAWTSFLNVITKAPVRYDGFIGADVGRRIHPTQKPVALYNWLLKNYAKPHDKILDTHLGSASSRIAAYKMGFDFWGCELDNEYFNQANDRFNTAIAMPLFDVPKQEIVQTKLY